MKKLGVNAPKNMEYTLTFEIEGRTYRRDINELKGAPSFRKFCVFLYYSFQGATDLYRINIFMQFPNHHIYKFVTYTSRHSYLTHPLQERKRVFLYL